MSTWCLVTIGCHTMLLVTLLTFPLKRPETGQSCERIFRHIFQAISVATRFFRMMVVLKVSEEKGLKDLPKDRLDQEKNTTMSKKCSNLKLHCMGCDMMLLVTSLTSPIERLR